MNATLMQAESTSPSRQHEHLQLLYIVNDMLRQAEADGLNISVILPRILHVAAVELQASTGSIIIIDKARSVEYGWHVDGNTNYETDYVPFVEEVMAHGIAGIATETQQPVSIQNTLTDERWLPRPNHATAVEPWSAVCAPLIARRRTIGAITLTKAGVAQFSQEDVDLLVAIGNQAAVNIENARLFAESQRQLSEAELFNTASKAINSSLNDNEVMRSMLSQMNELLNAEAISVARVDGDELVFTVADGDGAAEIVGLRVPRNVGIVGWVLENREPVLSNSPQNDPRHIRTGDQRTGTNTKAMIVAPLEANGRVMGTIQAINPPSGVFSADDLRILVRLASLASSAVAKSEQFMLTQAAEARYTNLFGDSIDPIFITDLNGIITEMNQQAVGFLGHSREKLIGVSIDTLHRQPIFELAGGLVGDVTGRIEVMQRHAIPNDATPIPVEIHVKRTFGPTHDEMQWIYHDISKQVELEQMRDDLTAMLFHDMQNPLSNVISSLELLEDDLLGDDIDPVAQMMVTIAHRSSQRLRHLIRSMLDINQLEAGHPVHEMQRVTVQSLFDYVAEMMEVPLQTKGLILDQQIDDDLPTIYVNSDMISRVIINLFDNAVKFSKRGDTISLIAALTDAENPTIAFSVSDEGPGIPATYRKSIFDKFYRTPNNTSKGMGLGLAFCRLAVEAHGGTIWADEAASGGAKFVFTIPVKEEA